MGSLTLRDMLNASLLAPAVAAASSAAAQEPLCADKVGRRPLAAIAFGAEEVDPSIRSRRIIAASPATLVICDGSHFDAKRWRYCRSWFRFCSIRRMQ